MTPTDRVSALGFRAVIASALVCALALGNAGCATTIIMTTDYPQRRPSQYEWLYADLAVVGSTLTAGSIVYATREDSKTRKTAGILLLATAGAWTAWNLIFLSVLTMPRSSTSSSPPPVKGGVVRP